MTHYEPTPEEIIWLQAAALHSDMGALHERIKTEKLPADVPLVLEALAQKIAEIQALCEMRRAAEWQMMLPLSLNNCIH
jgi:hypothetical protein